MNHKQKIQNNGLILYKIYMIICMNKSILRLMHRKIKYQQQGSIHLRKILILILVLYNYIKQRLLILDKNKGKENIIFSLENIEKFCNQQNQMRNQGIKDIFKLIVKELKNIKVNILIFRMIKKLKKVKEGKFNAKKCLIEPINKLIWWLNEKKIQDLSKCNQSLLVNLSKINVCVIDTDQKCNNLLKIQTLNNQKINLANKEILLFKNEQKLIEDLVAAQAAQAKQTQIKMQQMEEKNNNIFLNQTYKQLIYHRNQKNWEIFKMNTRQITKTEIINKADEQINNSQVKISSQVNKKLSQISQSSDDVKKQIQKIKNEIKLLKQAKLDINIIKNMQEIPYQVTKNKKETQNIIKNLLDAIQTNKKQAEKDIKNLISKLNKIYQRLQTTTSRKSEQKQEIPSYLRMARFRTQMGQNQSVTSRIQFIGGQWAINLVDVASIVKVRIDFETMNVQWEVGNQIKYKWVCSKLKCKNIQWVPMVVMGFKNDTIQWID